MCPMQSTFRCADRRPRHPERLSGVLGSRSAVPPAPTAPAAVDCSSDRYNCGDFSSCREVLAVFTACPGDPNGLDGDGDGTPCESLCG